MKLFKNTCSAGFESTDGKNVDLKCDKSARPHINHHDPKTDVVYRASLRSGIVIDDGDLRMKKIRK